MVIILKNSVELDPPMPHAKFQGHRLLVLEKKISKGFNHIWAWRLSWSFAWTIYMNFRSSFRRDIRIKFGIIERSSVLKKEDV